MADKVRVYKKDCDPSEAEDKSLPYIAYLVEYSQDGMTKFDICIAGKRVDLFDHYYDQYKQDFVTFTQTQGRMNPRLWVDPTAATDKK